MTRWCLCVLAITMTAGCGGEGDTTPDDSGSGDGGGQTTTAGLPSPPPELYVDPTGGDDTSDGSVKAPFRTLKKALQEAHAGQTVRLQGGTYSVQSGEDWSTAVADGVALVAVTPGQAVLAGTSDATALHFDGDSDVRSLRIEGFGQALAADTGNHTWIDIDLKDNHTGVVLSGSAQAEGEAFDIQSQATGIVTGLEVRGAASFTLRNSAVHDLGAGCGHGNVAWITAAATFVGAGLDIHDADGAFEVHGAAKATLATSTMTNVGANGCGNGEAIAVGDTAFLDLDDVTMSGLRGEALLTDGVARVLVTGGTIATGEMPAVVVRGGAVRMESTKLDAAKTKLGALTTMAGASLSAAGVTFSGCQLCVLVTGGSVALRNSSFESAGTAVELASGTLDLGSVDDPGGNAFTTVNGTALHVTGKGPLEIPAAGNLWRATQGAALGIYTAGSTIEGPAGCADATPRNYCVEHDATLDL